MPRGWETEARAFYTGVLGLPEISGPALPGEPGGCWFETGPVKLHVGVDDDFHPAQRARMALVVDGLDAVVATARMLGCKASEPEPLGDFTQVYVCDPFGNQLELLQPLLSDLSRA